MWVLVLCTVVSAVLCDNKHGINIFQFEYRDLITSTIHLDRCIAKLTWKIPFFNSFGWSYLCSKPHISLVFIYKNIIYRKTIKDIVIKTLQTESCLKYAVRTIEKSKFKNSNLSHRSIFSSPLCEFYVFRHMFVPTFESLFELDAVFRHVGCWSEDFVECWVKSVENKFSTDA